MANHISLPRGLLGWRSSGRRGPPRAALRKFFPTSTLPDVRATAPTFPHSQPSAAFCGLASLCFLSWPLRGLPWPPRGLASPTLLPVAWPCFAYFASWPSVTAAWPYFAHFLLCFLFWPLRGLPWPPRGLASPNYFASRPGPCVAFRGPRVALLCLLCFLSRVAFRDRRVALLCSLSTSLPVLAPAWLSMAAAWPCFAYFASCHA